MVFHRALGACASKLKGKNLISIDCLSTLELEGLLDRAALYKNMYKTGERHLPMLGKNMGMIFQKRSTRTRISTEVGMGKLGGQALFLSTDDIQVGVNESIRDTANVLSRFHDLILARVNDHNDILSLVEHANIPVINGLSDVHHPLQALADMLTIREELDTTKNKTLAWVGDGNNIIHDLMLACPKLGMHVHIATPKGYEPNQSVLSRAKQLATENNTNLYVTHDPLEAVQNANIISTDTWTSMGQESQHKKRLQDFEGFQVNASLAQHANSDFKFLHCLPRHQEEVDDTVFYGPNSVVFSQAENRMWTTMAVITALHGVV